MILLDTNVVSEVLKPDASPIVLTWLRRLQLQTVYLSAPSLAELLVGIAFLPDGERKRALATKLTQFVNRRLASRVLDFDRPAAECYAELVGQARRRGRAIAPVDGQIAAIATVHGFTVATRDIQPFVAGNVPVTNPWDDGAPSS